MLNCLCLYSNFSILYLNNGESMKSPRYMEILCTDMYLPRHCWWQSEISIDCDKVTLRQLIQPDLQSNLVTRRSLFSANCTAWKSIPRKYQQIIHSFMSLQGLIKVIITVIFTKNKMSLRCTQKPDKWNKV